MELQNPIHLGARNNFYADDIFLLNTNKKTKEFSIFCSSPKNSSSKKPTIKTISSSVSPKDYNEQKSPNPIDISYFENIGEKILEHKIKIKLDFSTDEFEEDLTQLRKRSDESYNRNAKIMQLYPFETPIRLTPHQIELYATYLGIRVFNGDIRKFLKKCGKDLPVEAFKRLIFPKIQEHTELFESVILWVYKRYKLHRKIFCFSKSQFEKEFLKNYIRRKNRDDCKLDLKSKRPEYFLNQDNQLIKKTTKGRTTVYTNIEIA